MSIGMKNFTLRVPKFNRQFVEKLKTIRCICSDQSYVESYEGVAEATGYECAGCPWARRISDPQWYEGHLYQNYDYECFWNYAIGETPCNWNTDLFDEDEFKKWKEEGDED